MKQRNEEEEVLGLGLFFDLGGVGKGKRECLERGIDICLNFQNFRLGFVAFGFGVLCSLSLSVMYLSVYV